jgi:hypothetical protein
MELWPRLASAAGAFLLSGVLHPARNRLKRIEPVSLGFAVMALKSRE